MSFYIPLYVVTIAIHASALFWGFRTWKKGEAIFMDSTPFNFFTSPIEREFWAVCLGITGNLSFIFIKPFYLFEFAGHSTGWQELIWAYGHFSVGLCLLIWHHKAYYDIKKHIDGE